MSTKAVVAASMTTCAPLLVVFALQLLTPAAGCGGRQRSPAAQLMDARRFDEAAAAYRQRLLQDAEDAEAREGYAAARRAAASEHQLRGQQHEKEYRLDEAIAELQLAGELDPELEAARTDLSRIRRQRRLLARQIGEVRQMLGQGNCIGAREQIDPIYAYLPTFPELRPLREQAMKDCYEREMTLARLFFDLGNFEQALHFLDQAAAYFPGHPEVTGQRKRAEAGIFCRQGMKQSAELLAQRDAPAAADALRGVLERCPESSDAREAWAEARRRGLAAALQAGQQAGRSQNPLPALISYETAMGLGIEDAVLQASVEQLASHYRQVVAELLLAAGEQERAAGLPGAALIRFRLADRLVPGFPGVQEQASQVEAAAAAEATLVVAVLPPENPGSFPWLGKEIGAELARALQAELAGDASIRVVEGYQDRPVLTVGGRIEEFTVETPLPQLDNWPLEAVVGERRETNPALAEALRRSIAARRLVRDHPDDAGARQAALQAQAALAATPPLLIRQEKTTVALPVARLSIQGRARLQLVVGEREAGETLARPLVLADYRNEESFWQGFPPAGVEGHEGSLPTVEAVRRRLVLDLVDKAKGELLRALRGRQAQRLAQLARKSTGSEAVHYWALALLAGGEGAAEAREQLRQRTGYVEGERGRGYDVRRISY